jgi:histidinol dehydrogenase
MGMMRTFKIVKLASRRGRQALARLDRRADHVLDPKVMRKVADIVDTVHVDGDHGLRRLVKRLDRVRVRSIQALRLEPTLLSADALPAGFPEGLERAITAVERYHRTQVHPGHRVAEDGVELIEQRRPLRRVGIYVPGGRAAYPSTAVMTVIPAQLAGVEEIVVVTPAGSFARNKALRHTLARLGVGEVWGLGGAHAVAALAYGTETIRRVDKIVGPGNQWVTAAKHKVSADVAIDGLAGPSEVVIVAQGDVDPQRIAADLLAQAEHDPLATAVLVTDRRGLAEAVRTALGARLPHLATAAVAKASLRRQGCAFVVDDMADALALVERLAPEHVQLVGVGAEALAEQVRNAGAVFVGADTPEVLGDYVAGPSHVLPTGGTARFASALGVEDFVRRSHVIRYTRAAAARDAVAAAAIAEVEGLPAHAAAARLRLAEDADD